MKFITEKNFVKWSLVVGVLLVGLTSFLGYQTTQLQFDYDFEKFFPAEDKDADYFYQHREKFEYDNNFILIALEDKGGIFSIPFMERVDSLTKRLEDNIPYVTGVRSITNQNEVSLFGINNAVQRPYVELEMWRDSSSQFIAKDSARIFNSKELINTLVSRDGKSVCIFLKHDNGLSVKKSDVLVREVKARISGFDFDGVHLAGTTVGQRYYIEKMNSELLFFMALSAVLVILFLFIAFRSGWGILLPQVVIFSTLVWVIGGMGLFNTPMNILLTTLPSIMFVVAMSDVIHLVSRYMDALREGLSKFESIRTTLREVGFSTFLTSLTTSIGFFSLYFINVQPVKMFGLIIGIGVLLAFFLSILFLPILFYYFPSPKIIEKKRETLWGRFLPKAYDWILSHKKTVWISSAIFIGLSIFGMTLLKADNLLMDDLKETDPIKSDFYYFDQHYGGYRPFELAVTVLDSSSNAWSLNVLRELEEVEVYLEDTMGIELKTSLVQSVKVLNRSSHFGNAAYFKLPNKTRDVKRFRRFLKLAEKGKLLPLFLDSTERLTRIQGTISDLGNNIITARTVRFQEYLEKRDFKNIAVRVTGSAYLLDKNIRYLSNSLIYGLLLSIGVVSIIMGFVFKSFRMVLISLLPNTIPLIFIAAIMGYLGIEVKVSTSIIFTIAFGIAVDDTIHLLGKFKFELMKGKSINDALRHSFIVTGKAMILTTLVLCSGFLLLLFSTFMGTFNMGLLLGITLFVALILDLTLLPLLILTFYKEPSQAQD
ncbi:MAG: MMPL family transporter [Crocinitomicaceae bacterium]|tara:strand:- start:89 stop:2389 length:2301 start_codon:yes stop_codon:yes gene_type:complete